MDKKEVSTSTSKCESEAVASEEAEPQVLIADDSTASSEISVDNVESLATRLRKFNDESQKQFQKLFRQIRSVAENISNAIREVSIHIDIRERRRHANEEASSN